MARYIDIEEFFKHFSCTSCTFDIIEYLREIPTADVVEVVRCKGCKHYRESKNFAGQVKMYCDKWSLDKLICTKPDDFCSYGERRDT